MNPLLKSQINTSRQRSVSILQAAQEVPILAKLVDLTRDSSARLKAIETLIPASLKKSITAGPIDGAVWCLILDNSAAAAKIRQLLPAITSHLRSKGWEINSIRIKVQISGSRPEPRH